MALEGFDTGGGGSEGPWITWSARGAQDGTVPPQSFALRDQNGRTAFAGFTESGVILDIEHMKTGWCYSSGVAGQAPVWKWNPSISQFMEKPGDDYKKGFSMRCAIGGGQTATWEDSGAGAWNGFTGLVPALQQGPQGKLPLVKMTGARVEKYTRGSTVIPELQVIQWVDRPDCLKSGAAAGIATDPQPKTEAAAPAAPPPPPPAAQQPAHSPNEF